MRQVAAEREQAEQAEAQARVATDRWHHILVYMAAGLREQILGDGSSILLDANGKQIENPFGRG